MRWWRVIVGSGVLLVAACVGAVAAEEAPPVLTVCEILSDLRQYEGKLVIVVGRFSETDGGGPWLSEDCVTNGHHVNASIPLTYASEFGSPPSLLSGFEWDESTLQKKLRQVTATTKLQKYKRPAVNDRWAAQFGRLEKRPPTRPIASDGPTVQLAESSGGFRELRIR